MFVYQSSFWRPTDLEAVINSESLTVIINNLVLATKPTQPTKIIENANVVSVVPNNETNNNNHTRVGEQRKYQLISLWLYQFMFQHENLNMNQ